MTVLNLQVSASTDDAHQGSGTNDAGRGFNPASVIDTTNTLLSPGSHGSNDEYSAGARFLNVTIANAATINSATFTFTAQATYNASPSVVSFLASAEAVDDAATFGSGTNRLGTSQRARSTAVSAEWVQTSITVDTEYSISITSVIQEIINRAGWVSGNDIVIIIDTHANTTTGEWQDYNSYNGSTTKAPKLSIDYTVGGAVFTPRLALLGVG